MQYNFEWDPSKATQNYRKHKVALERGAQVFADPSALSIFDEEHSAHEDRWVTIGRDASGVLLVVIHTFREVDPDDCSIRLISARKATKTESKQYSTR